MKKFISLVLAAAMAVTAIPTTAFAAASTKVSRRPTVEVDNSFGVKESDNNPGDFANDAPYMVFELDTMPTTGESFKVQLTNAEWAFDFGDDDEIDFSGITGTGNGDYRGQKIEKITKLTDKTILVELQGNEALDNVILPLAVTGKNTGTIEARVYDGSSVLEGTYNIGYVGETSTSATVADTVNFSNKGDVKNIIIEESTPGSFKDGTLTISVGGNFKFVDLDDIKINLVRPSDITLTGITNPTFNSSKTELKWDITGLNLSNRPSEKQTELGILQISGLTVQEDGATSGDEVNLTIRGCGIERQTLNVGAFIEFDVDIKAEDKELPTFYSGQVANEEDEETLKVTLKETVENSWWAGRKTTIEAPDGVKFKSVEIKNKGNKVVMNTKEDGDYKAWFPSATLETGADEYNVTVDADKITISDLVVKEGEKAELEFVFELSIDPGFSGDIDLVFGGPALEADTAVTVAKAVQPITVTAEANPVSIDYRKVPVSNITIKENYAGALKTDTKFAIGFEDDLISFDGDVNFEVTEGDIKIDKVKVNKSNIEVEIKTASGKTPSTIVLSGLGLYLERNLPQGDYALQLKEVNAGNGDESSIDESIFRSYIEKEDDDEALFDTDTVDVIDNYVTVVTQGRDKDDSTFATKVVVTINSTTMSVNGEEKTIPVAPYIREGRTMVPVRAITEALATSSNAEPVQWIDSARTVVIYYGSRIITMKLGEAQMTINGSPIPMNVAPEIVNDYTFIPLRDLGTALGLTDAQIVWDEAAQTVTFN